MPSPKYFDDVHSLPKPRELAGNSRVVARCGGEISVTRDCVAERVGFEPTVPFGTHAFQACALSRSAISPEVSLAEREGFEPSMGFTPYSLSRGAPSATRPPLRTGQDTLIFRFRGRASEGGSPDNGELGGAHLPGEGGAKRHQRAVAPPARKWRRGRDSNPRGACTPGGFQDRCLQPLGHLSAQRNRALTAYQPQPLSNKYPRRDFVAPTSPRVSIMCRRARSQGASRGSQPHG